MRYPLQCECGFCTKFCAVRKPGLFGQFGMPIAGLPCMQAHPTLNITWQLSFRFIHRSAPPERSVRLPDPFWDISFDQRHTLGPCWQSLTISLRGLPTAGPPMCTFMEQCPDSCTFAIFLGTKLLFYKPLNETSCPALQVLWGEQVTPWLHRKFAGAW